MEAAGSLDTLGLIARSVEDVALYRDVLLGVAPQPLAAPGTDAPRIGFCRTPFWSRCEPATQALLEDCAARLARAGAKVSDVTLPPEFERVEDAHRWISSFDFARNRAWEIDRHWERISETLRNKRLKDGLACSFEKYREAKSFAAGLRRRLGDVVRRCHLPLSPSASGGAPLGLGSTGDASFCAIWTTTHVPSVALPLFHGPNRLPVRPQLVAPRDHS